MNMPLAAVFLIAYGAEALVGITTNAFIVAVSLLRWAEGTVPNPNDQVVFSLGMSNLCVQGTSATAVFSSFFCQELFGDGFSSQVFWFFFMFSNVASLWLTAVLFLHYFLTMNRTSHPIFWRAKAIFAKYTPWVVFYYFLSDFVLALLVALCPTPYLPPCAVANCTSRSSEPFVRFCRSDYFRMGVLSTLFIGPFVITSSQLFKILTDLWRHVWNIKKTAPGAGEPSLKVYRDATKTFTSLLVLYDFYSLTWIIFYNSPPSRTWFLVVTTMFSILTSAQAVTFILRNPRLKQEARGILRRCRPSAADKRGNSTDAVPYVTSA